MTRSTSGRAPSLDGHDPRRPRRGTRRAAVPDPAAPGGWRTDPEVKAAILAWFRDRATTSWDLGGASASATAPGCRPSRCSTAGGGGALEAGRPWRIVPGGTSVRAGVYLGPGVVVMPPSFVNVGAWIGEDTMVDCHVLVGSCAQVGARVHLSAGVTHRRGARAGRRAAGHRRGRRVRRRGLVAARGRAGRGGRRDRRGRRADGDVAAVRSRPRAGADRDAGRAARGPTRGRRRPGHARLDGPFAGEHGLAVAVALLVKDRDAGTDARVALEEALR